MTLGFKRRRREIRQPPNGFEKGNGPIRQVVVISCAESRGYLTTLGIAGVIVPTPGPSDDSVSLRAEGAKLVYPGHGPFRSL